MVFTNETLSIAGQNVPGVKTQGLGKTALEKAILGALYASSNVTHLQASTDLNTALASTRVVGRNFTLNTTITRAMADGDVAYLDVDKLTGTGKINFHAAETPVGAANDIGVDSDAVTLTSGSVTVGQHVVVQGDINHVDYTPARLTSARVVGRVLSVNGSTFVLDKNIPYGMTNVQVSAIPNCKLIILGQIEGVAIDIENVPYIQMGVSMQGNISEQGTYFDINTCANLKGAIHFDNATCLIGAAFNNVSGGEWQISQEATCGDDIGSKVCRGNAVINSKVTYIGTNARFKDFGFHGCRNVIFNVKSHRGGAFMHDSGDTSNNRLESVVLAECQGVEIYAMISEANDQALELIACTDVDIYGTISNGKNTVTNEGALIIKGESNDIRIHGQVRSYGGRGVKLECSLGAKNIKFKPTCDIYSSSSVPLSIRDSNSGPYQADIEVYGTYRGAGPIELNQDVLGTTIDAIIDMANTTAGVVLKAPIKMLSIRGINCESNKQLASIGSECTAYAFGVVYGDSDGCYIQLNNDARNIFSFNAARQLNCRVQMGGNSTYFDFRGGVPFSNVVPTLGNYEAGDFYHRYASNKPSGTMEIGQKYDGSAWNQMFATI